MKERRKKAKQKNKNKEITEEKWAKMTRKVSEELKMIVALLSPACITHNTEWEKDNRFKKRTFSGWMTSSPAHNIPNQLVNTACIQTTLLISSAAVLTAELHLELMFQGYNYWFTGSMFGKSRFKPNVFGCEVRLADHGSVDPLCFSKQPTEYINGTSQKTVLWTSAKMALHLQWDSLIIFIYPP